jgi:hypothetical protein
MTKLQIPDKKTITTYKITNNQISSYRLRICLVIVVWLLVIDIYLELEKLVIGIYLVIEAYPPPIGGNMLTTSPSWRI